MDIIFENNNTKHGAMDIIFKNNNTKLNATNLLFKDYGPPEFSFAMIYK